MNLEQLLQWSDGLSEEEARKATAALGFCWEYAGKRSGDLPDPERVESRVRRDAEKAQVPWFSFRARFDTITEEWLAQYSARQMLAFFIGLEDFILYSPARIELQGRLHPESLEIVQWLSQLHPCTLRNDRPGVAISWKWPLRLGFGSNGASEELRQACARNMAERHVSWAPDLASTITVNEHRPECDILYLPFNGTLPDWLQVLSPGAISADAVVVVSPFKIPFDLLVTIFRSARRAFRPSAVAWQLIGSDANGNVRLEEAAEFSTHIVREISHSLPFDAAFYQAALNAALPSGVVVSSRRFLRNSALGNRMFNQKAILSRLPKRELELFPESRILKSVGGVIGQIDVRLLARHFPESFTDAGFFSEREMATTMRNIDAETTDVIREEEPARFLQAKVLPGDKPRSNAEPLAAFVRNQSHTVDVCIAGRIEGWLSPALGTPFPDEELPAELDEHEVMISLAVLHDPYPCWSKTVILPRRGSSGTARFRIDELPNAETVTLRVLISFRNRILQTALIQGSIIDQAGDVPETPLSLTIESLTANRFDGLHERSRFTNALLVNRTADDSEAITFISDADIRMVGLRGDVEKQRARIDDAISKIAYDIEGYDRLDATKTQTFLRGLAYRGRELRRQIEQLNDNNPLKARIQILCVTPDHQLPIEYCYDGERPIDDAPICPNARQALEEGSCPAQCPVGSDTKTVVCPLQFYACNRVIERFVFDPKKSDATVDGFEEQWRSGTAAKPEMNPFDCILYGLSQEVSNYDPELPTRLRQALGRLPKGTLHSVGTWPDWKAKLVKHPSTLLVIGHVELDDDLFGDIQTIEIGGSSPPLRAPEWDEHVKVHDAPQPLVILLGCEAGSPEIKYLGFVSGILRGGAGIVMTTNSTIHSQHAVDLMQALLPKLRDVCEKEGTFGEALRDARRMTLAEGSPMALCVMAFGDADWRLLRSDWFTEPFNEGAETAMDPPPDGAASEPDQSENDAEDEEFEGERALTGV